MPDHAASPPPLPAPTPELYPLPLIARAEASAHSVAILLRTRHRPLLLSRALASICAQTHRDWHLYLVNDGGDAAAIEALTTAHAPALAGRLTMIHRGGGAHGIWPAGQAALERAGEDIIAIHDDDDSWEPGFLATVTAFLDDPAHVGLVGVTTGCTLIEEEIRDGQVHERWRCPWPHGRATVDFRRALVDAQLPPISLVFRRAAIASIGGFETRLRFLGDWEFLLRLLMIGDIGHIDVPLANYHHRVRDTDGPYGNTVVDQQAARAEQVVLLHNAMLRAGLRDRPEMLGPMRALLASVAEIDPGPRLATLAQDLAAARIAADENAARIIEATARMTAAASAQQAALATSLHADLAARLDRLEAGMAELRQVAAWHRSLLRPLRWAWHRALPLRRVVARARGRVPAPPPPARLAPWMIRLMDLPVIGPRLLRRELIRRHVHHHGRPPELDPPRGFNAHMVARILHDRDPRLKVINDKLAVREVVRAALGEAVLVPLLGAWEDPGEVPWDSLKLPFMMKPSHGSGLTHAVRRPEEVQAATLTAMARAWLAHDYYESSPEWGYRGIPRRLLIEPLLRGPDGGPPLEAQVFTFGGRVTHIRICSGPKNEPGRRNNWFDAKGTPLTITQNYPMGDYRLERALADRLATMAGVLAAGHVHLRVDFLVTADGPLFAELTPYTGAGADKWDPPEADLEFGRLWEEGAARITRPPPAAPRLPVRRRLLDVPIVGPRVLKDEMIRRHTRFHGHPPRLDPPSGFNAHIINRILYDRDPRLKVLSDKLAIRPLIRDALGEAVLPPLLGVWDNAALVPWEALPLPFVMKPSHASGLIHVVRSAEEVVPTYLTDLAGSWLVRDYFDTSFEWGYRGIPRRLLIQPVFRGPDGDTPPEAQVFTFGGHASHVRVFTGGRDNDRRRDNWFDREARRVPMRLSSPMGDYVLDPALAARLVGMAETVAKGHVHLRVDVLLTDAGPLLSELTAYTFAGAAPFNPPEMDIVFGRLWEEGVARLAGR